MPKICVIVRKAYGAGLYAMCGPAFEPDACLALPTASIAVMGPEAAVNAVYYNKLAVPPGAERPAEVERLQREFREDVDLVRLAADLVVDAVVDPDDLRAELSRRLAFAAGKEREFTDRRHGSRRESPPGPPGRSGPCWWPTGGRSPCGCCGPAGSWG